ncbi:MAG TPA: hypothetical protein VGL99_04175 [Chloroflexota bacterium]
MTVERGQAIDETLVFGIGGGSGALWRRGVQYSAQHTSGSVGARVGEEAARELWRLGARSGSGVAVRRGGADQESSKRLPLG